MYRGGWRAEMKGSALASEGALNPSYYLGKIDINLQISKSTSAIARDAQRDSSSMITIAAVTMFFLPGTFISVRLSCWS
jgi:hypothetical protein